MIIKEERNIINCSIDRQRQNKWIRALHEPLAGVETEKACMTFNDVHKNGDHKLILVDFKGEPCRLVLFQASVFETLIINLFLNDFRV